MNTSTVVGLFDYYSNADSAAKALHGHGVDGSRISVVTRDNDTIKQGSDAAGSAATGAATGAAAGGLVGLLAGLSALVIPGIGPVDRNRYHSQHIGCHPGNDSGWRWNWGGCGRSAGRPG